MAACPICAETFTTRKLSCKKDVGVCTEVKTNCCQMGICTSCLHSHIQSILAEGITGDGRKELKCPFGCGAELTDSQIRSNFQSFNRNFRNTILGYYFFHFLVIIRFISKKNDEFYRFWSTYTRSSSERKDLELYERWSLTVAISKAPPASLPLPPAFHQTISANNKKKKVEEADANEHYVHVIRCPRPDCECFWLSSKSYRRKKEVHEAKSSAKSSISNWLFYSPIEPDKEESIADKHGYTTDHWLGPRDIDLFDSTVSASARSDMRIRLDQQMSRYGGENDGRRVSCPKCQMVFCSLCTKPWITISSNGRKRVSHTGKLCTSYQRKSAKASDDADDYTAVADEMDARLCPGCGMRISRTDGCNHMTCSCGYEFCYWCECRWNPTHYSCSKRPVNPSSESCIIS